MNVSDQILDEIKERWAEAIAFLDKDKGQRQKITMPVLREGVFHYVDVTSPAKDIRYLLNRLEAAEQAARATAAMNQKLYTQLKDKTP